jgi:hypothetical protein
MNADPGDDATGVGGATEKADMADPTQTEPSRSEPKKPEPRKPEPKGPQARRPEQKKKMAGGLRVKLALVAAAGALYALGFGTAYAMNTQGDPPKPETKLQEIQYDMHNGNTVTCLQTLGNVVGLDCDFANEVPAGGPPPGPPPPPPGEPPAPSVPPNSPPP